ncbi:divergent polysaccharide deacetylase family protein [Seohaeicola nanhaiensis]|uniref:Divergent polysaccharide deacetylase family protein n=1 Tax=Seohaeicola nanhaiensis TaxID=1387282 RepID=A0ABV9KNM7_9RHOB
MRGFLGGIVLGGVVVGVGLVALSVVAPVTPVPEVGSEAPDATSGSTASGQNDVSVAGKDSHVVEAVPNAPSGGAAPGAPAGGADTAPAAQPAVAASPEAPAGQGDGATTAGVSFKSESAVQAQDSAMAPETPAAPDPVAASEPASPPAISGTPSATQSPPEGSTVSVVAGASESAPTANPTAPISQPAQDPVPSVSTEAIDPPAPVTEPAATVPSAQAEDGAPAVTAEGGTPPDGTVSPVRAPLADPAPNASTVPADAPATVAAPKEGVAPADEAVAAAPQPFSAPAMAEPPATIAAPESRDAPIAVPESDTAPALDEAAPSGTPRVIVLSRNETSEEGDLRPTIGKRVLPLTERGTEEPAAAPQTAAAVDLPPLDRYAVPFENPEDKPLMAIVLIDDDLSLGMEALREFPYPLTFAVDPTAPDAAAKMARHRAAGFEVVALVDLPRAGTAQDAEIALSASFARLPEALAVLEGTQSGIQGNRPMSDQVSAFAGASGRGVITQGNGLNTTQKLAVREGIPAVPVFRDFDGAGQSPAVMRRFLDQAAFRAGQEGAVVMLGRVRPDTISALLLWALQDRVTRIALAPVSAVLKASVAGK